MADSSKIGAVSFVRVCHTSTIDILVTDSAAPRMPLTRYASPGPR